MVENMRIKSKVLGCFISCILVFNSVIVSAQCNSNQLELRNAYSSYPIEAFNLYPDFQICSIKKSGQVELKGVVRDKNSEEVLPFVQIVKVKKLDNEQYERTEEIQESTENGSFEIKTKVAEDEGIIFFYVGYKTMFLKINFIDD